MGLIKICQNLRSEITVLGIYVKNSEILLRFDF